MNGGRRCYVVMVDPPRYVLSGDDQTENLKIVRQKLLGVRGQSEAEATGMERLLLIDEVAIIDIPDLYAFRPTPGPPPETLGGSDREVCFLPCSKIRGQVGSVQAQHVQQGMVPCFTEADVFDSQKSMFARCISERWRVLLLLNVPWDSLSGLPPTPDFADRWRLRFDNLVRTQVFAETQEMSCAALYYPWVRYQDRVGAPIREMPPSSFVAGVIARRDLERGPHVSPANEVVRGVIQLTWPIDEDVQANLYPSGPDDFEQMPSVNVLRSFAGFGIQVWGARTLSTDKYLRFLSVRRCLSAIQRRIKFALDALVFEPNSAVLWMQITQIVFSTLQTLYESGALRGERIEQAFYVRCDSTTNGPDDIQSGRVLCEVGVAIVAPAEFIVFRLGRREGVVEVVE